MPRKAFKFYRSYFDVYAQLKDRDKVAFMDALLNKQFHDIEPNLEGMAQFAYMSQKHSIDAQVEGFKTKTKSKLDTPTQGGSEGGYVGGSQAPKQQEKEKEKEQYVIPSLAEFGSYALTKIQELKKENPDKYRTAIALKYEAWKENGWRDGNDKPIKRWKSKLLQTIPHLKPSEDNGNIDYSKYIQ